MSRQVAMPPGARRERRRSTIVNPALAAVIQNESRGLELSDTTAKFGNSSFDVKRYINDFFVSHGIGKATHEKEELEERKKLTSQALKNYVTDHYRKFIDTSKEIVNIESDMISLSNLLSDYRSVMKALQQTRLSQDNNTEKKSRAKLDSDDDEPPPRPRGEEEIQKHSVAHEDMQVLEELAEELGGLIYERKFEQAVSIIETALERMDELDARAVFSARPAVDQRIEQLVELLSFDLQSGTIKPGDRRRLLSYLIRLGQIDKALSTFLQTHSLAIKADIRKIKFQGDLAVYVTDLSSLVTQHLTAIAAEFRRLFSDRNVLSSFITWTLEELDHFSSLFSRQVFQADNYPVSKIGECLKIAFVSFKSLESHGLRLSFVLAKNFTAPLLELMEREISSLDAVIVKALSVETWATTELWVRDPRANKTPRGARAKPSHRAVQLTESAKTLYEVISRVIQDLKQLLNNQLYPQTASDMYLPIVSGTIHLFERYILRMTAALTPAGNEEEVDLNGNGLNDEQFLAIVANNFYLADDLLPRTARQFEKQFERPIQELEQFQVKLQRLYRALRDQLAVHRAPFWISHVLQWEQQAPVIYAALTLNEDIMVAAPSPMFIQMVEFLVRLRELVLALLPPDALEPILQSALEQVFKALVDDRYWMNVNLGHGGLQQLMLDVRYLLAAASDYINETVQAAADGLIDKAQAIYADESGIPISTVQNSFNPIWFQSIIDSKLQRKISEYPIENRGSASANRMGDVNVDDD
eukprot:TRINITY_DN4136_c0_g1_i1.p1 TRINITY_DN4136_c0_g1~~TRINITY_DN4136_c0_g1_i1.p1  ORF type:complete len:758 (-),score=220.96 TRINITY_DN4136_c0_g1_i1:88-2361(-)